ncbi:MAG TPA: pitrilysin family protein [Lysobacter sp.]|nr:pitrilysin family protein [Lysobacter sp.]
MKNITLLAAALSLALAGHAVAGPKAALPKELPPYAPDRPLPVPQIEKATLANGLEVWIVPRTGLPRVDAVLAVRNAGLAADDAQHPGFASLFASLFAEGTATRDSRAIAETAQGLGGGVGASASADGVLLSGNALVSHAPAMIALLGEVARTPTFPENEVRLAQANALQGLKAAEAQPGFKAERALGEAIYGDHPYARTQPTEAAITSVTPQMLREAHAQRFRPDRALLVVAGPIDRAVAMRAVEAAFGNWTATGAPLPDTPAAVRTTPPKHVLVQRDGSVQSAIRLGRPGIAATDADWAPLQLAGTVLGGGFSSRLMQNLREDKGYTYGARGGIGPLRQGGRISASADVRNEVTGAAVKEFMGEFKRMGEERVPSQELEDTKRYVAGGYLLSNQMQGAVAATLASNWLVGLPAEFLGEYVPKIRAVDAAQVQAMARKYLDPKDQSIVVVGDAKAVAGQLEPYGTFDVRSK